MTTKGRYPFGRKEATVLVALYHFNNGQRIAVLQKADAKLVLRKLASTDITLQRRKNIIVQSGGFLPALLAPLIGTLLANLMNK